jgi:hypothetical protein
LHGVFGGCGTFTLDRWIASDGLFRRLEVVVVVVVVIPVKLILVILVRTQQFPPFRLVVVDFRFEVQIPQPELGVADFLGNKRVHECSEFRITVEKEGNLVCVCVCGELGLPGWKPGVVLDSWVLQEEVGRGMEIV